MAIELDHIFICTDVGAEAAAARLRAIGLTEGTANEHPGQGTACRRFFFCNAYIELLWVSDEAEARSALVRPTRLWERWAGRDGGACPIGIAVRPRDAPTVVPFERWAYRPPYLPAPLCIEIAANADVVTEPMLFHLSFAKRPDAQSGATRQPMEHGAGVREITRVGLVLPNAGGVSPTLKVVEEAGLLRVRAGAECLMEVGFDGETRGMNADLRPELPLALSW